MGYAARSSVSRQALNRVDVEGEHQTADLGDLVTATIRTSFDCQLRFHVDYKAFFDEIRK